MIWLLQYSASGDGASDSNVQRLAIAQTREDVLDNNWCWYDLNPGHFGYNAAGNWLDFPDLATSDEYLYWTTNVYSTTGGFVGSGLVKIPLNQLAD